MAKFILILTVFHSDGVSIDSNAEFSSDELCKKAASEWISQIKDNGRLRHYSAICVEG